MRVLHLIDSAGLYGAEKAMLALAHEQARRGGEVIVGSIGTSGQEKRVETAARAQGLGVIRVEMPAGLSLGNIRNLSEVLLSLQCDVVHTHGYKPNVLMALQAAEARRPIHVVTLHGWTSLRRWSRNAFYESLDRALLFRADAVAIASERMRTRLPRAIRFRARCITNGLPVGVAEPRPIPALIEEFCARAPTVVCVGRLSPEKDQDTILRALAEPSAGATIQALFLGDGPLRDRLVSSARELGIENRVLFPGYVEDAWRVFFSCRAMIISSVTEGLPITLLEAMRARLPVISTPVGEIPVVTGGSKGALFFPVNDVRALAELIGDSVLGSGESIKRAEYSYHRFAEGFSILKTTDSYDELYELAQRQSRLVKL